MMGQARKNDGPKGLPHRHQMVQTLMVLTQAGTGDAAVSFAD